MFEKPIVMLDFETSGMSPEQGGRVTEVAALRIVGNQIVDRYVSLVNCHIRISPFITELTGITQAMLNKAPPASEVIPELVEFIGNDTLAAHNASFDEKFLQAESDRLGLWPSYDGVVCSVKLSRRMFPGLSSYSLGRLASSLGIRFHGAAHRAEADAEVSAHLLLRIAEKLRKDYDILQVDPRLLQEINKLTAAKVPAYLKKLTTKPVSSPAGIEIRHPSSGTKNHQSQRYRHYKGGIYEFICEAIHEADLTPVVVYRAQNGSVWTRNREVFFEKIDLNGVMTPRFTLLEEGNEPGK
ncbi:DUF1653 domain-containing protein [Undibacterium sp. Jales W-56]|uniref:DUF1653 domain-containing protein n=1 Tax=Undibacterium sp. Jales W-56 TaxID=2897325 RepID=UPI00292D20B7|nr:DUF1653 domain-containing protein [Undibacterium sp. Jales W-56]